MEANGSETMIKWALIAAVAMTFIVRLPDIITVLALALK